MPRFVASIYFCIIVVLCGCGGGGGGGGSPTPSQPTPPTGADFELTPTPSSFGITSGSSSTVQVTTTATGSATGSVAFTAASNASGVTFAFSPASAPLGTPVTLIVSVARNGPGVFSSIPITITGTNGSFTHTASVSGSVLIGGGTLDNVVFPANTAIPLADRTAITQAIAYAQKTVPALVGGCSSSGTTNVTFDPTSPRFSYTASANGQAASITMNSLPSTYQFFWIAFAHELAGNACVNADVPAFTGDLLGDISRESVFDPMAQFAADVFLRQAAIDNQFGGGVANSFLEATLNMRTIALLDPLTVAGNRVTAPYDQLFEDGIRGFYGVLIGSSKIPTLAAYEQQYYAAENGNGDYLTGAQLHTFFNNYSIDGEPAGDWVAGTGFSIMFSSPTTDTHARLGGYLLLPNVPTPSLTMLGFTSTVTGDATPALSGVATVTVTTNTGGSTSISPNTTDLSQLVPTAPLALDLSSLATSAYNMTTTADVNGTSVSRTVVALAVPGSDTCNVSQSTFGNFCVFVYPSDATGKAVTGTLTAGTDATVKYTAPDNSFIVLQPKAGSTTGVVTVIKPDHTSHSITFSPNGSQVVPLPIQ
jgi:hypothetical protein